MNRYACIVTLIFFSLTLAKKESESFIIKKDKTMSAASLKEHCCEKVFDTISLSPSSVAELARCQELWLALMPLLLDNSFFNAKDRKSVEKNAQTIDTIFERQKTINTLIKQQIADLEALQ